MESAEQDQRYIGLYSSEERKALFLRYYGGDSQQHTVHANAPTSQDPYDPSSWPSASALENEAWQQPDQRGTLDTFAGALHGTQPDYTARAHLDASTP